MRNIQCFLGLHEWTKWIHVGMDGKHNEKFKRRCRRCQKAEYQTSLTGKLLEGNEKTLTYF